MSTLNVANITDGTDTVETGYVVNGSAKAWVNFDGTGTIAIRDSLNVASLTDNGTGNYTVNFSIAFATANYAVGECRFGSVSGNIRSLLTTSCNLGSYGATGAFIDVGVETALFLGDLA